MAKVVFGNGVTSISGSIGGNTYSRNRFGPYIRTRALPVNPNTTFQQLARSRFATISAQWRQVTAGQREGWNTAAETIYNSNPQGFPAPLSGAMLFQSYNNTQLMIGGGIVLSAPPVDKSGEVLGATPIFDLSPVATMTIDTIVGEGIADNQILVYASPAVSPGRYFFRPSDYRLLQWQNQNDQPFDILTAWTQRYGALHSALAGQKVSLLLRGMSGNGYLGTSFRVDTIFQP